MDRRSFLKKAGLAAGATAGAATLAAPAVAQNKRELKMVTTWPKNFPGLGVGAQRVADRITAATNGELTVKLFAGGELVPPFEVFDAVSNGTADMYHGADYYFIGKHKAFAFFTGVPFGMTPAEHNAWIYHGGGQQLWDELAAGFNLKGFMAGNTGLQAGGWFRKEINSIEDMKGLKMRMPGLGGEVLRRLGASAVALPGAEVFPALQSGAIDATEWVGAWNDMAFGFYKVAKFYYVKGFHEPSAALSCTWNKEVFDSLTPSQQAAVEAACAAENDYMFSEYNYNNGLALQTLINKHGVQVRDFPDDVFDAMGKAAEEVTSEVKDVDAFGAKLYESWTKSRAATSDWIDRAERNYVKGRSRILG